MKFLITGGCGFLGSNLSREVLARGLRSQSESKLVVVDNLSRLGSETNLTWLKKQGDFDFHQVDVSDAHAIESVVKEHRPDVVFHLAGQVAMTTSLSDPRLDFTTNALGTFNVLDAVRKYAKDASFIYSSTNKVYGDLEQLKYQETDSRYICPDYPAGFDESVPLNFCSPYGCSKGAADQYVLDYARMFGLKTVVFRHSSIFGTRQFSSSDQGWIGWFMGEYLRRKRGLIDRKQPIVIAGNGKQVRDVLFSEDLISVYFAALQNMERIRGRVYNLGGGMQNSLSLLELFSWLEKRLEIQVEIDKRQSRESDQKVFVANCARAHQDFDWQPTLSLHEGLERMLAWMEELLAKSEAGPEGK